MEHGRLTCLGFCSALHANFPREIRDMVYDILLQSWKLVFVNEWNPETYFNAVSPPHWWRSDYVGDFISFELAERWYKTATFQFTQDYYGSVSRFLMNDIWRKDIVPNNVVRFVKIDISADDIDKEAYRNGIMKSLEELCKIGSEKGEVHICV